MILITSAAYIDLELQSEFGCLPPAFLPVGNKHLFFHQVDILKSYFNDEAIYMSIPESFIVSDLEREFINNLNISIVSIPDKLRLSDSILYAINSIGNYNIRSFRQRLTPQALESLSTHDNHTTFR